MHKITAHLASCKAPATGAVLKYLAEETRHAWFLKRTAERALCRELSYQRADLLGSRRTHSYIDRLDNYICRFVGIGQAYICSSYIVEIRANWCYGTYQSVLTSFDDELSLRSLLAEEQRHLEELESRLWTIEKGLVGGLHYENQLFHELLVDLESCVLSSGHARGLLS